MRPLADVELQTVLLVPHLMSLAKGFPSGDNACAMPRASHLATEEQRQRLTAAIVHSTNLTQFGAAEKTLEKDDCAWPMHTIAQ
ncbi:hypothetical protein AB1Y20_021325 [Prymnesium parvum]|uniref:Uncharacterized protein n=1 Tax=Prymnesium parvum TaxID=97485 RepID=A0AB34JHY0_PRYPA